MSDIDRKALGIIEEMEKELSTFAGLRDLWSVAVANHVPMVASPERLMERQRQALHAAIRSSLVLHSYLWPDADSPHRDYRRISLDKKPIAEDVTTAFDLSIEINFEGNAAATKKAKYLQRIVTEILTQPGTDHQRIWIDRLFEVAGLGLESTYPE